MMSVNRVDPSHDGLLTTDQLASVIHLLENDEMIVAPTETRFALIVRADSIVALDALFNAKGRAMTAPSAVFAKDRNAIFLLGEENRNASRLCDCFLPGPMTLVLKNRSSLPTRIVVEQKIGVRYSSSPLIQQLVNHATFALTATSANKSGSGDHESIEAIVADFGDTVATYINNPPLRGATSTVVDCTGETARILREGKIPAAEITHCLMKESA